MAATVMPIVELAEVNAQGALREVARREFVQEPSHEVQSAALLHPLVPLELENIVGVADPVRLLTTGPNVDSPTVALLGSPTLERDLVPVGRGVGHLLRRLNYGRELLAIEHPPRLGAVPERLSHEHAPTTVGHEGHLAKGHRERHLRATLP